MDAERIKRKVKSIQPLCKNKVCQDLGYVTRGKEKRRRQVINVVASSDGWVVGVCELLPCEWCVKKSHEADKIIKLVIYFISNQL